MLASELVGAVRVRGDKWYWTKCHSTMNNAHWLWRAWIRMEGWTPVQSDATSTRRSASGCVLDAEDGISAGIVTDKLLVMCSHSTRADEAEHRGTSV